MLREIEPNASCQYRMVAHFNTKLALNVSLSSRLALHFGLREVTIHRAETGQRPQLELIWPPSIYFPGFQQRGRNPQSSSQFTPSKSHFDACYVKLVAKRLYCCRKGLSGITIWPKMTARNSDFALCNTQQCYSPPVGEREKQIAPRFK